MHDASSSAEVATSNKRYWWYLCRCRCLATDLSNAMGGAVIRKPTVLQWHQVPEWSREPGILTGYRPDECSWSECCRSLVSANNETFNIWSHAIAAAYFVWRTVRLARRWGYINQTDDDEAFDNDHYCRAFIVYLISACLYPAMSAVAHGLCALSHRARIIGFLVDYAAISNYSFGCAVLYRAYVLPEDWMTPGWTEVYLGTAVCLSLASTVLTCWSRALETDIVRQRIMRLAAFTLPYIWDTIPLVDRLANRQVSGGDDLHAVQIVVALLASFAYATHLPERLFPGTFDYVGHSHNLLHVCGVAATLFQLEASLVDLSARRERLTSARLALVAARWTLVAPVLVPIGHATILTGFARYMFTHPEVEERTKERTKCH